ncbi:hypothetical protein F0562_026037 [Nyssa sinensis]|uniref:Uncharacterized protein n=1 Tax=Nyssa sinensis TaxID=561372 RepID=A0A5J5B7W4_9ASTE|nr:hypothetical protein F0562_026037 [Nyssa sinensis]
MGGFATGDGDPRTTTAGQSEMVLRDRQWSFAIGQCKRGTVREREGEVADGVDLEKDPSILVSCLALQDQIMLNGI